MRRPARIPRSVPEGRRKPNEKLRAKHLDFVRSLEICVACGARGPVDPAHVRMSDGAHSKFNTMSRKDDRFALPLCAQCHRVDQHVKNSERGFWARLGIDPVDVSARLFAVSGDYEQGMRTMERALQAIALHRGT